MPFDMTNDGADIDMLQENILDFDKSTIWRQTIWFNQIAASDDAKKFLSNLGSDPLLGSAELVDKMIAKETQEWSEYVRIAKIEPQ